MVHTSRGSAKAEPTRSEAATITDVYRMLNLFCKIQQKGRVELK